MDLHIIPECYIDTKLVKALVPPLNRYNHQKGCSTVVKVMQEKFAGGFAVGIVDRDKQELGYAKYFELISEIPNILQLYKYGNHYLIFINPAIEKWIISNANEAGISLTDYNLPHDFKELTKITKSSKSENEDLHSVDFKNLFKELKKRSPPSVTVLSFWIQYLRDNPYNADMEFIKSETQRILS